MLPYPYTPWKEDELELRKGEMFLVFERCQDGWFKGTSMHTSKIGVFPGNYVAPITRAMTSASQGKVPMLTTGPVSRGGGGVLANPPPRRRTCPEVPREQRGWRSQGPHGRGVGSSYPDKLPG